MRHQSRGGVGRGLAAGAVPGLLIVLAACGQPPAAEAPVRPVRTVTVQITDISARPTLTGEIRARTEADLSFRTDGKLIARLADAGALVKKGAVLARLDSDDAKNKHVSAQSAVSSARAELQLAQTQEARQRELLAKGVTTQSRYDDALRTLRTAQARTESAMADLRVATDRIDYTELRAEFDGVITAVGAGAEAGKVVGAGQMIVRLARPGEKDAVLSVSEAILLANPEAPPIEISLASNPDIKVVGQVREVSPQADPVTRTFTVKVALTNAPDSMLLGAVVVARAILPPRPAVELPSTALFDKGGQPAVWLVDPAASTVALKPVKLLRYDTSRVVVEEGLVQGDVVVTAGVNTLREGQKVRLLTAAEPKA